MDKGKSMSVLCVFGLSTMALGFLIVVLFFFIYGPYSSESNLLFNLKIICLGIAVELLGLGLIIIGKR